MERRKLTKEDVNKVRNIECFPIGIYENSRFPQGEEALDQFFRQMTPDTGDFDQTVIAQAVAVTIDEVYEKTGKDSILVTHSQGGMLLKTVHG